MDYHSDNVFKLRIDNIFVYDNSPKKQAELCDIEISDDENENDKEDKRKTDRQLAEMRAHLKVVC